jgi:hypothetical protein
MTPTNNWMKDGSLCAATASDAKPREALPELPPRRELGRLPSYGRLVGRTALLLAVPLQEFPAKGFDVGVNHSGRQLLGLFHDATPGKMDGLSRLSIEPAAVLSNRPAR